jgi:glycosyltransferase involved in cell wall biosynthesis
VKILALEPYFGGSHRRFLDGWSAHSRHRWTILDLPAHHWKWRMRHAALTAAESANRQAKAGQRWDLVFASDMLNLAEFAGLAEASIHRLPRVVYFHENQLTYPVRQADPRDVHFALTNLASAQAASRVWFNSAYHCHSFLEALAELLRRMPDYPMPDLLAQIRTKSIVQWPGVDRFPPRGPRLAGPLRILWAARWEHDKNPGDFFHALDLLARRGTAFRLNVVGEQFRDVPPVFASARERFHDRIDRWGYQAQRGDYQSALQASDVVVSTARHEFFGIGMVEAMAAGCRPLLPRRLAYPELLAPLGAAAERFFYDGTPESLAESLATLAERIADPERWQAESAPAVRAMERFEWPCRASQMDAALEELGP